MNAAKAPMGVMAEESTLQGFLASVQAAAREFAVRQRGQLGNNDATSAHFLDFSQNVLTRPSGHALALPRSLPMCMLEELLRFGRLRLPKFLLLDRSRPPPGEWRGQGSPQLLSNYRHELTMLRRLIAQLDLPIQLARGAGIICATGNMKRIRTNVQEARHLARGAASRLGAADYGAAVFAAERALEMDFDCAAAASVVLRVLRTKGEQLTAGAVIRAQFCFARAITRCTRSLRRLPECTSTPAVARAREITQRRLERLDPLWNEMLSWPFDERPAPLADAHGDHAMKEFLEAWVKAFRGDVLGFRRFASCAVVAEVIQDLLHRRVKTLGAGTHPDLAEELTLELFKRLEACGWMPAPTASPQELRSQLRQFVSRRLDWRAVLSRSTSAATRFRRDARVRTATHRGRRGAPLT